MLPVLNHKSAAHWHSGCCCICSLPQPAQAPCTPGTLRCCPTVWGHASDLPKLCPGLDQLLSHHRMMDVAQIPPLLTGCSFAHCKNISYFSSEGRWGEQRVGTTTRRHPYVQLKPAADMGNPLCPFSTSGHLCGSVMEYCTQELGLRMSCNCLFISFF